MNAYRTYEDEALLDEEPLSFSIYNSGDWHVDADGLQNRFALYSLTAAQLSDSEWLPRLLDLSYSNADDVIAMWYLAKHVHDRGPRDRTERLEVRLRKPKKGFRRVPGTNIYLDAECTTTVATFATADAEAIRTNAPRLIESELGIDEEEVARSEERRTTFARLLKACPEEERPAHREELSALWCEVASVEALSGDQLRDIDRFLTRYSPVAISEAMKLAVEKHWRLGPRAFTRIGAWLRIVLEQVEEPAADRIHYLTRVVGALFPMVSERDAGKLLRAAAYYGVSLDALEKTTMRYRSFDSWAAMVKAEISLIARSRGHDVPSRFGRAPTA